MRRKLRRELTTFVQLDVGDEEKILLSSSDNQSLLVVRYGFIILAQQVVILGFGRYKDVKNCLDGAFEELYSTGDATRSNVPPYSPLSPPRTHLPTHPRSPSPGMGAPGRSFSSPQISRSSSVPYIPRGDPTRR